jgi:hypothetical protein
MKADHFDSRRELTFSSLRTGTIGPSPSVLCVVPYLSHGTFASLTIWLQEACNQRYLQLWSGAA